MKVKKEEETGTERLFKNLAFFELMNLKNWDF